MIQMGTIPIFIAVIDEGGFAAAGRKLGVTTSAVSKRISQLEEQLGARLVNRTTRKLSLTEAGEIYLHHVREALAAAGRAEEAVSGLQTEPVGLLRICAPMSFGRLHVAPLLPDFMAAHPGLEVDLTMDDRALDLVQEGFDIAIRTGRLSQNSLVARRLAPLRSLLCVSPAYLERHSAPNSPEDLLDHDCLHYSYAVDRQDWTFIDGEGQAAVVSPGGKLRVNNSEALMAAVLGGLGIGRLPSFVAGPKIASGRLVRLLPHYRMAEQSLYAVFAERHLMPRKVRAFIDFTVDRLGGDQPYWDRGLFDG